MFWCGKILGVWIWVMIGVSVLLNLRTSESKNPVWQGSSAGSKRRSSIWVAVKMEADSSLEYHVLFQPLSRLLVAALCAGWAAALRDFLRRRGGRMGMPSASNKTELSFWAWLVSSDSAHAVTTTGSDPESTTVRGADETASGGSGKWKAVCSSCGETGFESDKWGETVPLSPALPAELPPVPDPLRLTGPNKSLNLVSALDNCFFRLKFFLTFRLGPPTAAAAFSSSVIVIDSSSTVTSMARWSTSVSSLLVVSVSSTLCSCCSRWRWGCSCCWSCWCSATSF